MNKLPVALFVFRRPDLTRKVFDRVRAYKPQTLFLIADGPRVGVEGESQLTDQTRSVVDRIDWPCTVYRSFSDTNLGLRERLLTGLDLVFSKVDRAIILEDDCLPNEQFFTFLESMLEKYESDQRVAVVSGSNFAPYRSASCDYHFSTMPYIWGWGTWARSWDEFRKSPQVEHWPPEIEHDVLSGFSSKGQGRAFISMMREARRLNTWDVSLAVWFRQNRKLAVVPRQNLVQNLGFGSDATHTKFEAFDVDVPLGSLPPQLRHPAQVVADARRERIMWRSKQLKWITFPLLHPLDFTKRFLRYLRVR